MSLMASVTAWGVGVTRATRVCNSNATGRVRSLWGPSRPRRVPPVTLLTEQYPVPGAPMPEQAQSRAAVARCAFCGKLNRIDLARLPDGPKCAECHRPIRLGRPVKVTDADFDTVIGGTEAPVVVDFYADWCGPCRMMAPTLDEFAHDRTGEVLLLKLDTEANRAT